MDKQTVHSAIAEASNGALELAVVIPTYNEKVNVEALLSRLGDALTGIKWEAIYVDDDSPDGTSNAVREIAKTDRRVRIIQRIGRKGLSTAVIEGALATAAPFIAVIDGDLQHDESLLPHMLQTAVTEDYDVVIGSRYVEGGGVGDWSKDRQAASNLATRISRMIIPVNISDPMSGFFLIRREAFEARMRNLSGMGFKILLDILATGPKGLKVREIPYEFRLRHAGESKLDTSTLLDFLLLIIDKKVGRFVPARFILFAAIGGFGLLVHLSVLGISLRTLGFGFVISQSLATLVAMTSNYVLNNIFTFRENRRTGIRFFTGLLTFYVVCSVGAVANVGIAEVIYSNNVAWYFSGIAGVIVGSVWNYAVSSVYTWQR